jgi:rare lipoprotein A
VQNLLIAFMQVAAMTSINLVSRPLPRTFPAFAHECAAFGLAEPERAGAALACGVLLSSMLAVGCAAGLQGAETRTSAAKTPPRTQVTDGSPQSYEVLGKRYNVRPSSDGYRERGTASWYGHPFDGRPTSSGEMYDMMEMTAAHATLPLPTWVEVTNLKNGKRVVVKVNDRGPFVDKRLIDLSYAAATQLDMVRDGTTRVEVRALPGPPAEKTQPPRDTAPRKQTPPPTEKPPPRETPHPQNNQSPTLQAHAPAGTPEQPKAPVAQAKSRPASPPPTAEQRSSPADSERLFAEAGRFTSRDDAVELVASLRSEGFMNAFVVTEDKRRKSLHRVRVGPLADAAEVESMNDRLRDLGARRSHSVAMR